MVKGVAIDRASLGITVNNIQPGPTVMDMAVDHIEKKSARLFHWRMPESQTGLQLWLPTLPARSRAT